MCVGAFFCFCHGFSLSAVKLTNVKSEWEGEVRGSLVWGGGAENPSNSRTPQHLKPSEKLPTPTQSHTGTSGAHKSSQYGKTFLFMSRLTKHQRTHTVERLYQCSQCGKNFPLKSGLTSPPNSYRRTSTSLIPVWVEFHPLSTPDQPPKNSHRTQIPLFPVWKWLQIKSNINNPPEKRIQEYALLPVWAEFHLLISPAYAPASVHITTPSVGRALRNFFSGTPVNGSCSWTFWLKFDINF